MDQITLNATRRQVIGKKVKTLRKEGKLPAVLYGHGLESTPIVLDARDARKILGSVGSSTLITVNLDGVQHTVLVRERQRDVLTRDYLHVDFQALSMTEKVRAMVRIELSEEIAPAVKDYGAMLVIGVDQLEIECLPGDLIDRIVVDISSLKEVGDAIHVKDLPLPGNIDILGDLDAMVVTAAYQAPEEAEPSEEVEELEGYEPEVIERGKAEEEEGE